MPALPAKSFFALTIMRKSLEGTHRLFPHFRLHALHGLGGVIDDFLDIDAHQLPASLEPTAIDKLLDALMVIRGLALPEDPLLGRTHYTVGVIDGGVAPNVIPDLATAELLFRSVGPVVLRYKTTRHSSKEVIQGTGVQFRVFGEKVSGGMKNPPSGGIRYRLP